MVIRSNCSNYIETLIDKKSEDYTKITKMFLLIYIVKYGTKNINFGSSVYACHHDVAILEHTCISFHTYS